MKLIHSPKQKSCQRANTHITTDRQFHTSQQTISHITTDNFTPHNRPFHTSQHTISHLTTDHFTHHNRQIISHLTTYHFTHHNISFHTSQQTISHMTVRPFHTSQHTISVCVPRTWLKSSVDHCRLAIDSSTFISRDWSTITQNWW